MLLQSLENTVDFVFKSRKGSFPIRGDVGRHIGFISFVIKCHDLGAHVDWVFCFFFFREGMSKNGIIMLLL